MPETKKQRRFMGMVHAVQAGELEAPSANIAQAAERIPASVAKEIGSASEKGLPEKASKPSMKGTTGTISGKIKKIKA